MSATSTLRWLPASPVVPGVTWAVLYIAARLLLELSLPAPVRVLVALAPVVPAGLTLVGLVRAIAGMDELHRRVHLEALVVAFPLTLLLVMTLGLLEMAVGLSPDDWSYRHVWPFLLTFYALGLWRAWKRYL